MLGRVGRYIGVGGVRVLEGRSDGGVYDVLGDMDDCGGNGGLCGVLG